MHLGFPQFLEANLLPRWLEVLLTEKFFNAYIFHEDAKKKKKKKREEPLLHILATPLAQLGVARTPTIFFFFFWLKQDFF
jgi:hypothetical protein